MRSKRGLLVAFIGLDGAGKSTQIELLAEYLSQMGRRPVRLWTRGGYTPAFDALKRLLRRIARGRVLPASGPSEQRTQAFRRPWKRRLWLVLAILDLMWVYAIQIRWWRLWQRPVICDRYLLDTLLDFSINFPQENVEKWLLWKLLRGTAPQPDATFLLLVPVEESVRRSRLKHEPFPDPPERLSRRLEQYGKLAEKQRWHELSGLRPLRELEEEVKRIVREVDATITVIA